MTEEEIGKGTTTLDYLRIAHPWLAQMLDDAGAERDRLKEVNGELLEALEDCSRFLDGISSVNMHRQITIQKLRDLAEWRLEAKRVAPLTRAIITKAKQEPS